MPASPLPVLAHPSSLAIAKISHTTPLFLVATTMSHTLSTLVATVTSSHTSPTIVNPANGAVHQADSVIVASILQSFCTTLLGHSTVIATVIVTSTTTPVTTVVPTASSIEAFYHKRDCKSPAALAKYSFTILASACRFSLSTIGNLHWCSLDGLHNHNCRVCCHSGDRLRIYSHYTCRHYANIPGICQTLRLYRSLW